MIVCTLIYLEIAEPDSVVNNRECVHVVDEGLAFWVVVGSAECLFRKS